MSYRKEKVLVMDSQSGYDVLSKDYKKYHEDLDKWDGGFYQRFLPGQIPTLRILDIGGGDGRIAKKYGSNKPIKYTICDISPQMLKKAPSRAEKMLCDLEEPLELDNDSFDVVFCFFVLLHLSDLKTLFAEAYRVLDKGGRFIVLHHQERRPTEYKNGKDKFIIKTYNHRYDDIEKLADKTFFDVDYIDLKDKGIVFARLYCFTKS